jgi:hypothetical protein
MGGPPAVCLLAYRSAAHPAAARLSWTFGGTVEAANVRQELATGMMHRSTSQSSVSGLGKLLYFPFSGGNLCAGAKIGKFMVPRSEALDAGPR